jgi:hypothetical protein
MENNNKFDFLFSPVFWKLFLIGLTAGLNFPFPNNPWIEGLSAMIAIWFGGSVGVNTVNKIGEHMVEAANITSKQTTVTIPENVSAVSASTEKVNN